MVAIESYVAIMDVGHGNCTVLKDQANCLVVDCGPGSSLLEFLLQENIKEVESVFLSHADKDHIEGLVALIASDEVSIGNVFVNSDGIKTSKLWEDLIYSLSKNQQTNSPKLHAALTSADGIFSCGQIGLQPIGPSGYFAVKSPGGTDRQGRKLTSNSISSSFKVFWKGQNLAFLAGDIDQLALDDIKDHGQDIASPILVFPHHGGDCSGANIVDFTNELCDLCKPETVIFSIGRHKHNNPRTDVVSTVRKKIGNIKIACTQLSKNCADKISTTSPVHLNSFFSKGRAKNECCGGTFMIELGEKILYSPDFKSHLAFITSVASNPICVS